MEIKDEELVAQSWVRNILDILFTERETVNAVSAYTRTTDIGRLPINLESLHQVASWLREPPYAERHVRWWCERSETKDEPKSHKTF